MPNRFEDLNYRAGRLVAQMLPREERRLAWQGWDADHSRAEEQREQAPAGMPVALLYEGRSINLESGWCVDA